MKYIYPIIVAVILVTFSSCNNDIVNSNGSEEKIIYQRDGIIDSLVGTCSVYLTRNIYLDSVDAGSSTKAIFERNSFTTGDLSEVLLYVRREDSLKLIKGFSGKEEINNISRSEINIPAGKNNFLLRLKLYSSVCTGDNFYLRIKDIKLISLN